ncbi:MAG TPA: histidine kinase [Terriglobales bacterium]|nr:histidine kinase [Terriglobales bacterium]
MLYSTKVGKLLLDSIRSRNFWRLILITFALWTTFGVMNGVQYYANSADERATFPLRMITILTLGDAWIRAAVTIPLVLVLVSLHRKVRRWISRVALYCLLYVVFASAHFLIRPLVLPLVVRATPDSHVSSPKLSYREKVSVAAMSFWIPDLMGFACVVIVFNAWVYAQETQRRALNEERLAARLASAELQVLKMQLQPHFLFNTLNTIYNLAPQNSRKAQVMIARLSNLLRLSLDHVSSNMVPLQQELEFLESYLDIEKTRFEERLQIVQDIDPEALDAAVPNLLLQPLVENAIRHGINKKAAGGKIEIYAAKRGDRLRIMITDDGRPPQPSSSSSGIGMANTRARLTQLFGNDFSFELLAAGQGAQVLIDLPFKNVELNTKQQEHVG